MSLYTAPIGDTAYRRSPDALSANYLQGSDEYHLMIKGDTIDIGQMEVNRCHMWQVI
jgi:hypothetical protein